MARRPRLLASGLLYHVIAAIQAYSQHHNQCSKPFVWTANAKDIIAKYHRAKADLEKVQTAWDTTLEWGNQNERTDCFPLNVFFVVWSPSEPR